jgi:hypothetical protein
VLVLGLGPTGAMSPRSALAAGVGHPWIALAWASGGVVRPVAPLRRMLQGGACGIHPVVPGAGLALLPGPAGTD